MQVSVWMWAKLEPVAIMGTEIPCDIPSSFTVAHIEMNLGCMSVWCKMWPRFNLQVYIAVGFCA